MKSITEITVSEKKLNFDEAIQSIPKGKRLPTKKELMLMYVMNDETKLDLPKSNVWSSDEYVPKDGVSKSAFAVQLTNGYVAVVNKKEKFVAMYVKQ